MVIDYLWHRYFWLQSLSQTGNVENNVIHFRVTESDSRKHNSKQMQAGLTVLLGLNFLGQRWNPVLVTKLSDSLKKCNPPEFSELIFLECVEFEFYVICLHLHMSWLITFPPVLIYIFRFVY